MEVHGPAEHEAAGVGDGLRCAVCRGLHADLAEHLPEGRGERARDGGDKHQHERHARPWRVEHADALERAGALERRGEARRLAAAVPLARRHDDVCPVHPDEHEHEHPREDDAAEVGAEEQERARDEVPLPARPDAEAGDGERRDERDGDRDARDRRREARLARDRHDGAGEPRGDGDGEVEQRRARARQDLGRDLVERQRERQEGREHHDAEGAKGDRRRGLDREAPVTDGERERQPEQRAEKGRDEHRADHDGRRVRGEAEQSDRAREQQDRPEREVRVGRRLGHLAVQLVAVAPAQPERVGRGFLDARGVVVG